MATDEDDITPGGSTVYRYQKAKEWEVADGESHLEEISDHIEKPLGPIKSVFHEIVSDTVHVDVMWVEPSGERPFHTLITSGMSDRPMQVPEGLEELAFIELMVTLPENWQIDEKSFEDERWYWPVGNLKFLARFPHKFDTWLGDGHTIPNGDPPEPYASDTKLNGMLIVPPLMVSDDFRTLRAHDDVSIHFMSCVPLYQEEMDLKLKKGVDALLELFDKNDITELIDPARKNVARKRFGLF